tara:strand:- start:2882 stop:3091 length:210 start_codon:yes stop_codon:yes gene_type:complete
VTNPASYAAAVSEAERIVSGALTGSPFLSSREQRGTLAAIHEMRANAYPLLRAAFDEVLRHRPEVGSWR